MIQQLAESEQRLVSLAEELASRDLDTLRREMEDEEVSISYLAHGPPSHIHTHTHTKFRNTVEGGLSGNVKVEMPKTGEETSFYG